MDLFDLSGRTALVTGASMGIGLGLARALAAAGVRVVLNARGAERLEEAAATLRVEGAGVDILPFDVTDAEAAARAIDGYEARRPIDILINNAGIQHRAALEGFPVEAFDRLMRTNVNAAFYVARALAPHMIARGRGRIVNIASVQAALARPGIAPYTASKGAIVNLTKGMATDWARHGLCCNAIAPGYFDTPLNAALVADPEFCAWIERRTPAGRWGRIEDLAGACIFLASDASAFVNGQVIYVDGGMTACL
ncbi:gluconate 5-dehydrogenase [Rhodovulum sulfidophilum]|uniref:Glucose 1-dehydrogenase n=1 Tax=Rhodovulum visakhapatnamense TaxID=364297 RepID=A0ABS1RJJ6_9RHOB|nr:glucose 1-dehydrogenase [Rhodovulum visakhapatnamense]MBL3571536.1 glucose 1-dehydrogenase [Rhodovulum visakhapatnamense]MBL3579836.1 glucose 1-dehydrogenase [Rhodovulum visakhapatnamense]OLS45089.1 gluconate 5-dehydrogenase [Rhodovulum sulfidophilum]